MIFADLCPQDRVFIDANVFVYHFEPHPTFAVPCTQLLDRVERLEIEGVTSSHVLGEVAHRLMALEACSQFSWPYAGIAQRLQRHPAEVKRLSAYRAAIGRILQSKIECVAIVPSMVDAATSISQQFGLLSNDALIVAVMQSTGLTNLASHDADFDRVPGIARCAPL